MGDFCVSALDYVTDYVRQGKTMTDKIIELPGIFSEGYGVVPKRLMKASDINSNTKLVLCYLLSHTGSGQTCFPSMDNMADNLNISKRTIIRCIAEAVDAGYLSKTKNKLGRGKGTYNIYNLEFMADFTGAKIARANIASAKHGNASDKNDTMLVTPGNCNNNKYNNNNSNNNKRGFTPPTPAEVQAYLDEIGNHTINRDAFIDYYESRGWMIGKNKMRCWKAAVRTWARRDSEKPSKLDTVEARQNRVEELKKITGEA
jgi:hypothetical protein